MPKEIPTPPGAEVLSLRDAQKVREFASTAETELFSVQGAVGRVLERMHSGELAGDEFDVALTNALIEAYQALGEVYRRHVGITDDLWDRALKRPIF